MPWRPSKLKAPCGLTPREGQAASAADPARSAARRRGASRRGRASAGLDAARRLRWSWCGGSLMMTKLKMIMAASALCLTAAGGLALAKDQGDPAKKPGLMQKFDANGDGVLDAGEKEKMKEAFAAKRAARKAARIARFDTDKDG